MASCLRPSGGWLGSTITDETLDSMKKIQGILVILAHKLVVQGRREAMMNSHKWSQVQDFFLSASPNGIGNHGLKILIWLARESLL